MDKVKSMNTNFDNLKIIASPYLLATENVKTRKRCKYETWSTKKGAAQRTCMVIAHEQRGMQLNAMYIFCFCIF